MAEPPNRRSNRSRKPKIYFDEIVQPSRPSKPSIKPTASTKPPPATKSSRTPLESPLDPPLESPIDPQILDLVKDLCSQTAKLDIKAKKKAKSDEIGRLTKLGFQGVLEEIKPLKEVEYEPLILGDHREPKVNIPSNIDSTDPLALLDLFIPPIIYTTITENTNLYAISKNAPTAPTKSNSRYWWPTNKNEIRVLFGIFYYMGVHREPNFRIYWKTPKPNGPVHTLSKHMTLNRYENLRRFLHISKPVPEPLSKPVPEPVSKPVSEPVSKPVSEPVSKPPTEPVSKPLTEAPEDSSEEQELIEDRDI